MKKFFTLIAAVMLTAGAMAQEMSNEHWEFAGGDVQEGSGYNVKLSNITLTLMMGEKAKSPTWNTGESKQTATDLSGNEISYTNYVSAKDANGRTDIFGNTNCAYFQFEPVCSGTIQVMVQNAGTNKEVVAADITDGTQVNLPTKVYKDGVAVALDAAAKLENYEFSTNYTGYVDFAVTAGKKYIFCLGGSKVRVMGFSYTYDKTAGISSAINDKQDANAPAYNLAGQRVNANAKGLVIKNGKKYVNK